MKPSQQIAEGMAKNFVDTVHKENEQQGGFDTQDAVEKILLDTIPLTELIEVATIAEVVHFFSP